MHVRERTFLLAAVSHLPSQMKAVRCIPRVATAAAVLTVVACADPAAPTNPGRVLEITIDSAAGPISRTLVVRTDQPAPVEVTYAAPGAPTLAISADSLATVHRIALPRLREQRVYTVDAGVLAGTSEALRTTMTTGPLPPSVAGIQFTVTGTPSLPVALVEVAGGTTFTGLLVVEEAQVVGYIPIVGSLFGATRRANGDVVLLHSLEGLQVRRLDGTLVHRLPQPGPDAPAAYGTIHHDVTATPNNTLLFIANDSRVVDGESVVGEALWEWNPEARTVVKRWTAFDHLDWKVLRGSRTVAGNWLHGNGISYGPRGNVLMSLRNVNQVISIAPDFSRVEWTLGGANPTLALPEADRFYGQHYVTEPSPGRVLVFDNGFDRPGAAFSRAIEYAVDAQRGTATRVWQYRNDPEIYAALVGSTRRLPNGNTSVLFGMLQGHNSSTGPVTAVEVTPAGTVQWRLTAGPQLTRLYRVTPVESLLGERIVR